MSNSYLSPSLDHGDANLSDIEGTVIGFNISKSVKQLIATYGEEALTAAHIMAFTQRAWRLSPSRANNAKYIFACYHTAANHRKIIGVFQFGRLDEDNNPIDTFTKSAEPNRYTFLAEPAAPDVWNRYVNRYLPDPKQGEANPVRYYNETK